MTAELTLEDLQNSIINEFGGTRKYYFKKKLNLLIQLSRNEIITHDPEIKRHIIGTIEDSIKYIMNTPESGITKAQKIVDLFRKYPTWHHIIIIPDEIFNDFYNLYDCAKYGIEFDETREFQYFRVY